MVKTTVILEKELYEELVQESVRDYGSTRKLSFLINKKLKESKASRPKKAIMIKPIKLGRKLSEREVERAVEKGWGEAVKWTA